MVSRAWLVQRKLSGWLPAVCDDWRLVSLKAQVLLLSHVQSPSGISSLDFPAEALINRGTTQIGSK